MKGHIRISHLVYIIIIFIIVLSFFLVIAFGGLENAGTMMGTASTVSSLILSVVAIVLSLIDVAGQKQQIVDLKETAENLKDSNEKSIEQLENLKDQLVEVSLLKETLAEQESKNDEWQNKVMNLLEQSKQLADEENLQPDEFKKALFEINNEFEQFNDILKSERDRNSLSLSNDNIVHKIIIKFKFNKDFNKNEDEYLHDINVLLRKHYRIKSIRRTKIGNSSYTLVIGTRSAIDVVDILETIKSFDGIEIISIG